MPVYIPFFEIQVDILYDIASFRSDWLDSFFLFLDYFDSPYFPMLLIPIVWVGISPKWGLRVSLLNVFSGLINGYMKAFLDQPRPIVDFPDLAMLPFQSPGFPSGGAQTAMLMGGFLICSWKSRWAWVIAIPYILLISFSRLYLGVHYPTDVLGGAFIGLIILFIYMKSINRIELFCHDVGRGFCLLSCMIAGFLYLFLFPDFRFDHQLIGAFLGVTLGFYISIRFHPKRSPSTPSWRRILNVAITILVGAGLFFMLPHNLPQWLHAFIIAIWVSALAIPFCRFWQNSRA